MTLCRKQKQTTLFQMTEIYYLHITEWLKSTQATKQFEGTSSFVQLKFGVHFRLTMMMVSSPICTEQVFVCTAHLLWLCMQRGRQLHLTGFPVCFRG